MKYLVSIADSLVCGGEGKPPGVFPGAVVGGGQIAVASRKNLTRIPQVMTIAPMVTKSMLGFLVCVWWSVFVFGVFIFGVRFRQPIGKVN
jgi:hypothetical protein